MTGAGSPPGQGGGAPGCAALCRRLRVAGTAVLVAFLAAAAAAYRAAAPDDDRLLIAQLNNTKRYEYQMEAVGGKANILASDIKDGFLGLWRGKALARTLAVLGASGSLACFYAAHRLELVERRARGG